MNESKGISFDVHKLRRICSLAHASLGFLCKISAKIPYRILKSGATFTVNYILRLTLAS